MFQRLLKRFWQDDVGALIASEYLMLGSLVLLGSAGGLVSMRDAAVSEMKEYGNDIRSIRQRYGISAPTQTAPAPVQTQNQGSEIEFMSP